MEEQEERDRFRMRARETVRAAAVDLTEVGVGFPCLRQTSTRWSRFWSTSALSAERLPECFRPAC